MISPSGQNLVFLLSTPRSGSTLLSVLLNQLSEVHCPPEPWFLLRLLSLDQTGNPDAPYNDDFATLGTREFLGSPLSPDPLRAFACSAYNAKLAAADKSIFVDKTPRYYHILPQLGKLFPQARYLWLQRNPLDVAASYKTTWNIPVKDLFSEPARPETLDFIYGLDVLREFFATPAKTKLCIRYEDLVANTPETFARLQAFLGLKQPAVFDGKITRAMLAGFKSAHVGDPNIHKTQQVHAKSIDRWRTVLTPGEIQLVVSTLGSALFRKMGYAGVLDEAVTGKGRLPSDAAALKRRTILRGTAVKHRDAQTAQLKRLEADCREQTAYIAVLTQERDRLTAEAKAAQTEARRASQEGQKHIDALRRQTEALAATTGKQGAFITTLEKERDRLAGEAVQARRHRDESDGLIQSLKKQLDQLAATSLKQSDFIATLEKERDRLAATAGPGNPLRKQLNDLAATSRQQAEYIAILEKERDRLTAESQARAKDGAHYTEVIAEQTKYIKLLEARHDAGQTPTKS